ncbi:hypothetical protein H5410_054982 [Solanum commersonii]|uniref:Pyruvate kinase n=1 Tax=Solanum commersonii TaxID=4109 RepID=A0A9J5WIM7_SOLCO|nr:hypothetical protein H5410_054982 [Solanum commersonii]
MLQYSTIFSSFSISIILLFLSELSSLTAVAVTIGDRKNALGELAPRRTDSDGFDSRSIKAYVFSSNDEDCRHARTLGPKSRSVEIISSCLESGMPDAEFHQETLENLRTDIKKSKKLCAVMLDTGGPELQVVNKSEHPISLQADSFISEERRHYLFTGSETTSVWLEVTEVKGEDVVCFIQSSATLAGPLYTLHVSQIRIELPTLTDKDKKVISSWAVRNKIDILSLSYTQNAEDVRHARECLSKLGDLNQTQIFAKIENMEGMGHFDEILVEADIIILSRGNLGIDLPPEKCNMAGKPAVVTRVVDSMTDNLRPTRAEATDVANAVLDGSDAILLGAETLRGLYPIETISTVGKICAEVHAAIKVKAFVIICFTSLGRAARLIAKYRPPMPVLSVVIPRLKTNQLFWTFSGAFQARQSLIVRRMFPILADPRHPV